MNSDSQTLPPREASLYKKLLKHFREKQFKSGLKVANQILANPKHSEHGETLSMKGLILNSLGRKQEALEYVKRGLKNDVRSHVCWHVFGLLQKANHKYEEAIKCYRNALRLKKDSIQILSDLSLVQMQTRDLEGYRDSRYQLFVLRPSERSTWLGCAMAYHLTGDHMTSVNLILEYLKSNNSAVPQTASKLYEHSELLLYNISILLECKRYEEALQQLNLKETEIVDKATFYEYMAQIFLELGRFKQAETVILSQLFSRNSENLHYCRLLERANEVNDVDGKLRLYNQLAEQYPRSQTILREPLNFIEDLDIFKTKISEYLKRGFRKGQPALFRDLKHIYSTQLCDQFTSFTYSKHELDSMPAKVEDLKLFVAQNRRIKLPPKIAIIELLLWNFMDGLRSRNSFEASGTVDEEAVTCLLWVYYYAAQHFDALKEFSLALHFANSALLHTPTLIDVFVIKAKIFKHAGFPEKAVAFLEEAQSLDTSDRYLNSKCAKYLIRINKLKEAEDMCLKFSREGVPAAESLNEMQCMWFQTAMARAHQSSAQWGEALKKCVEIDNHFAEINEDQLDFNTYCILKVTLRAYVQMIRLEDHLKSHLFFFRAAKIAIEIYLSLYDKPALDQSKTDGDENAKLSASELKKLRNKERKAKAKADEKEKAAEKKGNEKKIDPEMKADPLEVIDPMQLQKSDTPLADAMRFLTPLKIFAANKIDTHLLAFQIYYRKGKPLLMLQSLKRSFMILSTPGSSNWTVLMGQVALFLDFVHSKREQLNDTVRMVIGQQVSTLTIFEELARLDEGGDVFNRLPRSEAFITQHISIDSTSFEARLQHLQVRRMIEKAGAEENKPMSEKALTFFTTALEKLGKQVDQLTDISLESATKLYRLVVQNDFGKLDPVLVEQLRSEFHSLFPYASKFMNASEIEALEKELTATDYFTADAEEVNGNNV